MLTVFNMLGTVVDADAGCNKLHGFLQYPPLVKSFAFTVMDMYLLRAFPGISVHGLPHAPK